MSDKNYDWPIHPKWLSIKKGFLESKVNPNSEGLFNPYTLRGFIADASAENHIQNAISIFQVIPKDYDCEDVDINERITKIDKNLLRSDYIKKILRDREIIRIDSGRIYGNITCCNAFRECTDKEGEGCRSKCFDLDCRIAFFYHQNLDSIHFDKDYDNYIDTLTNIVNEYNQSLKKENNEYQNYSVDPPYPFEITIDNKTHRSVYIKYQCFYSHLDEYFFPVMHSGKIIAVIVQGQRPHEGLKKEEMFRDFRNDTDANKKLNQSIESLSDSFFKEESLGDDRRNAIIHRINDLQEKTNDSVLSAAQKYVSEEFGKIEDEYRIGLQKTIFNPQIIKTYLVFIFHIC